jgi:hypothetical protein
MGFGSKGDWCFRNFNIKGNKSFRRRRTVGKRGRPKGLTPGEEEELRKRMQQDIDEKDEFTYEQFKQEVCTPYPLGMSTC